MSKLKDYYKENIRKELNNKFQYENVMQIPELKKVILNMGIAEITKEKDLIKNLTEELSLIAGQIPLVTKAKKSIAGFKLRQDQPLGLKVTLRGTRMYDFLTRFFNIVCPRIRDFRGFNIKCDGRGNFSLGIDDHTVFPELNLDKVKRTQGMHITFVTTAKTDDECRELLRQLGLPFKNMPISVTV